MSFLMNKLLQKKTPARKLPKPFPKLEGNDLNNGRVTLTLGELKTTFFNGEWIPEYSTWNETNRENSLLKMKITQLEEENNILKLKYEILLDIALQRSGEAINMQEIKNLRSGTDEYKCSKLYSGFTNESQNIPKRSNEAVAQESRSQNPCELKNVFVGN